MDNYKNKRREETIKNAAAEFIERETDNTSLVTVTNIDTRNKGKDIHILVTVLPEDRTESALFFLNRKRNAMRDFLKTKASMRTLPFFHFELDRGEKHRQKIDEIIYRENEKKE